MFEDVSQENGWDFSLCCNIFKISSRKLDFVTDIQEVIQIDELLSDQLMVTATTK